MFTVHHDQQNHSRNHDILLNFLNTVHVAILSPSPPQQASRSPPHQTRSLQISCELGLWRLGLFGLHQPYSMESMSRSRTHRSRMMKEMQEQEPPSQQMLLGPVPGGVPHPPQPGQVLVTLGVLAVIQLHYLKRASGRDKSSSSIRPHICH